MAGRGSQTFKKRQKEQQRKEKQQEKFAKRLERKTQDPSNPEVDTDEADPTAFTGDLVVDIDDSGRLTILDRAR